MKQATFKVCPDKICIVCLCFVLACCGYLVTAGAEKVPPPAVPVPRVDNNYEDWQNIRPVATFSLAYSPVYFRQEKAGQITTLEIEEARFWKRAGTLLKVIKVKKTDDTLYLYIESHSNFAANFSLFLYLFKERVKREENTCTLEVIPVASPQGASLILLWEKGKDKPRRCGRLASTDLQMELSLPLKELPAELHKAYAQLSFDISTCYQQKETGVYEDYFFTTIYAKDIR